MNSNKETYRSPVRLLLSAMGILLVITTSVAIYFYIDSRSGDDDATAVISEKSQVEAESVLNKVKELLLIDETEAPTVARIKDVDSLKESNQEFYKNAVVGDYLIIYPKRAIVYRESANQIINVAPISNTQGN